MRISTLAFLALLFLELPGAQLPAQNVVKLRIDATDAPRRLFHAQMTMPAKAGPMTLLYPQWIPGEHGPTGLINDVVEMVLTVAGKPVPWQRDAASSV